MSDVDKSSKTEEPTAKKKGEARSKGQFAKASEISMTTTLLAGLLAILFFAPGNAQFLGNFTKSLLENLDVITLNHEGASFMLKKAYETVAFVVLPLFILCFFAAFLSEGMQTGFSYTPKVIQPKLSKFNPVKRTKENLRN